MTILSVVVHFITSLSSYNSDNIIKLLILSSIMIVFSCIGSVVGIMLIRSYFKENSNSVKSLIIIVLLIVNVIILFRAIILIIFALL